MPAAGGFFRLPNRGMTCQCARWLNCRLTLPRRRRQDMTLGDLEVF